MPRDFFRRVLQRSGSHPAYCLDSQKRGERKPWHSQQLKRTWALWRREGTVKLGEMLMVQSDIKCGAVLPHVLKRCGLADYHHVRLPKRPSECDMCGRHVSTGTITCQP